jgi:hypothetical protein
MPYTARKVGDQYCVFKKDGGEKVGCTDGNEEALRKYMAALHINAKENTMKISKLRNMIREIVKQVMSDGYDANQTNDLADAIQLAFKEKGNSIRHFSILEPYIAKLQFEIYPGDLEIGEWQNGIANVILQGNTITQLRK